MAQPATVPPTKPATLTWERLPSVPDPLGLGYPFAGISNDALLVGGGSNFPEKPVWEGGPKVWYDTVYVLDHPQGKWAMAGKLPRPLAGGVSITTPQGVACLGGGDAKNSYADCFLLIWHEGQLETQPLPSLPRPCANFAGTLAGNTIYVAGGIEHTADTSALNTFHALDLTNLTAGWKELPTWPGPARMLPTLGTLGQKVYLFSGAELTSGPDGKPARNWLKDAYCYSPNDGWKKIADLPRVAVAAPTPAPVLDRSHLLILGGDDSTQVTVSHELHKGFPREILSYDAKNNHWSTAGEMPFSLVTTPTVLWQKAIVIPGGEMRPGIRSNQVWAGRLTP